MSEYKLLKIHGYGALKEAFVKVDAELYDWVSQWSWKISSPNGYARRTVRKKGGGFTTLYLHHLIINCVGEENVVVDHINGDHLDNRLENLRLCSCSENVINKHGSLGKCNHLGVCRHYDKYQARISRNNKRIYLGRFNTVEEAANAIKQYDKEHNHFVYAYT